VRVHIGEQFLAAALAHFARGGAHVRREHYVVHAHQCCGYVRLVNESIECGSGNRFSHQCMDQRRLINERATCVTGQSAA
jgi:hypothetical protein